MSTLTRVGHTGMVTGLVIAASPVIVVAALTARNIPGAVIQGLFLSAVTNGQWNTVFNVAITSAMLWQWTAVTCMVGLPIFAVSAALYAAGHAFPN